MFFVLLLFLADEVVDLALYFVTSVAAVAVFVVIIATHNR